MEMLKAYYNSCFYIIWNMLVKKVYLAFKIRTCPLRMCASLNVSECLRAVEAYGFLPAYSPRLLFN